MDSEKIHRVNKINAAYMIIILDISYAINDSIQISVDAAY